MKAAKRFVNKVLNALSDHIRRMPPANMEMSNKALSLNLHSRNKKLNLRFGEGKALAEDRDEKKERERERTFPVRLLWHRSFDK